VVILLALALSLLARSSQVARAGAPEDACCFHVASKAHVLHCACLCVNGVHACAMIVTLAQSTRPTQWCKLPTRCCENHLHADRGKGVSSLHCKANIRVRQYNIVSASDDSGSLP
jgi:hypothetical protein